MLQLDGDARMYRAFARHWKGFYAGAYREREPLFIFLLRLWCLCFGWSNRAVRGFTFTLFLLLVSTTGCFIALLSGNYTLGIAAGCLMALNPAWLRESTRGLRTELITLLLLVCLSMWLWTDQGVLLGFALGFLALTQSACALWMLLPFFWVMPSHWTWPQLLIATLFMLALYEPHAYAVAKRNGSWRWAENRYARYFANVEQRRDLPDSYVGSNMTWKKYYLELHTIPELLYGHLKGWVEANCYLMLSPVPYLYQATKQYIKYDDPLIGIVAGAGLPLVGLTIYGAFYAPPWVPLLALWSTLPMAFLYHKRLVEPFRNTARIYPLWLFCLLVGCGMVLR